MDTELKRFVDFAFGHPQIFVQLEAIELGPHVDAQHKRGLPIIEYSKGGRLLVAPTYLSDVADFQGAAADLDGRCRNRFHPVESPLSAKIPARSRSIPQPGRNQNIPVGKPIS